MNKPICLITINLMFLAPVFAQPRSVLTVSGQVSLEGTPQLAVEAWIRILQNGMVLEQRPTVKAGQFEFSLIAGGRYTLEVEAPGFAPAVADLTIGEWNPRAYILIDLRRPRKTAANLPGVVSLAESLIPKNARQEFERARDQQKQLKCDRALAHFEKALKIYSNYAAAHNEMGNCLVRLGNIDKAEQSFKSAVKLATTVYPSINLADLYVKQNRWEDARNVLRAAIRSNPGEGDAYYALALVYFEEGLFAEAETAALEADTRKHRIADLHLLLAKIYLRKNNAAAVFEQLEVFLKEEPPGSRADEIRQQLREMRRKMEP